MSENGVPVTVEDIEWVEEPVEGDFVIFDSGPLLSRTSVAIVGGGYLGEFKTDKGAETAIRAKAEADQFWPSVWYQDDHGGIQVRKFRYYPVGRKKR